MIQEILRLIERIDFQVHHVDESVRIGEWEIRLFYDSRGPMEEVRITVLTPGGIRIEL